jgi:hypothetical protein
MVLRLPIKQPQSACIGGAQVDADRMILAIRCWKCRPSVQGERVSTDDRWLSWLMRVPGTILFQNEAVQALKGTEALQPNA